MKPKEILKKLRNKQGKLIGKRKGLQGDIQSIDAEIGTVEEEVSQARFNVAREEEKEFIANLYRFGVELRQGNIMRIWNDIQTNISILKDNDPLFFTQADKHLSKLDVVKDEHRELFSNLVIDCLSQSDDFAPFLLWVAHRRRRDNSPFFSGGDE